MNERSVPFFDDIAGRPHWSLPSRPYSTFPYIFLAGSRSVWHGAWCSRRSTPS